MKPDKNDIDELQTVAWLYDERIILIDQGWDERIDITVNYLGKVVGRRVLYEDVTIEKVREISQVLKDILSGASVPSADMVFLSQKIVP